MLSDIGTESHAGSSMRVFPQPSPLDFAPPTLVSKGLERIHESSGELVKQVPDVSPRIVKSKKKHQGLTFRDLVEWPWHDFINHRVKMNMLQPFLDSMYFQTFILLVILFNTAMICIETDEKLKQREAMLFQVSDSVCVTIFAMEIVLKLVADFVDFWFHLWNWFDLVIVVVSIAGSGFPFFSSVRVIRVLRVFRSFRIFHGVMIVPGLQKIFNAFLGSLRDVVLVMFLNFMFVVVAAFVGVSLFAKSSPVWFGDIWKSMYSLVILLTMDGWLDMYYDLRDKGETALAMVYIYIVILVGANIFVNVLVGVSTNALKVTQAEYDAAERSEAILRQVEDARNLEDNLKEMRTPPLTSESVWSSQKQIEVPSFQRIDPNVLSKIYIIQAMANDNSDVIGSHLRAIEEISKKLAS